MLDSELQTVQDLIADCNVATEDFRVEVLLDDHITCCESAKESFEAIELQLDDLIALESKLIDQRGVSRIDASTLESWHPGIFGEKIHIKSFTQQPSINNFRATVEAINWKKVGLISASIAVIGGSLYLIYKQLNDMDKKLKAKESERKRAEKEMSRMKKEQEETLKKAAENLKEAPNVSDEIIESLSELSTHAEFIVKRDKVNTEYNALQSLPEGLRNRCFLDLMDAQPTDILRMWESYVKGPLEDSITQSLNYYQAIFDYLNMTFRELKNFEHALETDMDPFDFDDCVAELKQELEERWQIRQHKSKLVTQDIRDFVRSYQHLIPEMNTNQHWTLIANSVSKLMTSYLDQPITHDDLNQTLGEVQGKSIFYYITRQFDQSRLPFPLLEVASKKILGHSKSSSDWNEKITKQVQEMEKAFEESKWHGRIDEVRRNEIAKWAAQRIGIPNGMADAMSNVRANTLPDNNSLAPHLRDKLKEVMDFAVKAQNQFTFQTRKQIRELSTILSSRAEFTRDTLSIQTINWRLMDLHFQALLAQPQEYIERWDTLIANLEPYDDSVEVRKIIKGARQESKRLKKYANILLRKSKF